MKETVADKKISYRDLGLTLSDDQEITADNVMYLGEGVAVSSLKTYMIYSNRDLYKLYKGLIHNMSKTLRLSEHYTDGYDLAQEAACFLCEYIGHKLGDEYITKTGKKTNIARAALRHIVRILEHKYGYRHCEVSIKVCEYKPVEMIEQDLTDYTAYDEIIEKSHITDKELDVLNCYMSGMEFVETARFLGINNSTVWRRQQSAKRKFTITFG